ncbi:MULTISPECIES: ABC transporter substrate-binding protein [unclassified Leptolyngbya]|uniref:ABC transporter substrate-binding protein n=1 Tax=unclassified Leptolyngbya TaxID=2650499 RepID=UPI0016886703|nr:MULTISPECIES: ABC transporter substrate-binding protein [unclassified Leptolyngbya]MBD1912740.1 ABC transporter substrate-binding protein [Leptolyngbya sp. FACHB-8]MBD2155746.1 ABC transporter substrate-binding protein [Leptolyngbya sp. FACHB-16]
MFALTRRLLIICLVTLLGLTGCQNPRAKESDVIHLTLWQGVNPPPNRDVLQRLVDRFNQEHPDIQVESLYVGQSDQQTPKVLAAIVGNATPDLLWFAPMFTGQLVELEAIRPLEDWLTESGLKEQIGPALFESMTWEGHIWSIPFGTNNVGIFYRPTLFEAAGIREVPHTWEELRAVAKQLTDPSKDQHGMLLPLGKGEWSVFTWLPFMWSGGGELTEANPSEPGAEPKVTLNNVGAIAALHLWQDLISDGSVVLSGPERGYEVDGFLAGKVAMQLTGPWTLGQLQATGVDFAVMPIPEGARRATSTGGENLFLLKSTPEREKAAQTFMAYVLSEDFQTQWAIETGYLPVNVRSRESQAYKDFMAKQAAVDVFLEQAEYGRSRPIFPGYNRISDSLGRAIEAVVLGKATPEEALEDSQRRLDLALGQ